MKGHGSGSRLMMMKNGMCRAIRAGCGGWSGAGANFLGRKWLLEKALGRAEKYFREMGKFLVE